MDQRTLYHVFFICIVLYCIWFSLESIPAVSTHLHWFSKPSMNVLLSIRNMSSVLMQQVSCKTCMWVCVISYMVYRNSTPIVCCVLSLRGWTFNIVTVESVGCNTNQTNTSFLDWSVAKDENYDARLSGGCNGLRSSFGNPVKSVRTRLPMHRFDVWLCFKLHIQYFRFQHSFEKYIQP